MITSTDGMGNTTEYTYNGLDQILKKKVPFYIDNSGKMNYTEYIYNYDAVGNLEREYVTSGTTSKYEYDYRLDGNMSDKTESYNYCNTETTYSYDTAGRLSKEDVISDGENFNIAYTYDTAGNRSSMKLSGYSGNYTENYSYDKNNKLLSSVKDYGTTSAYTNYTYDKNGNQTKVEKYSKNNNGRFKLDIVNAVYGTENAGAEKFTYNGLNQLTGYENINGNYNGKVGLNAEYKYIANGYRVSKNVNGIETRYLWDRDNIAAELNSVNVVSQKYCRGYNLICDDSNVYYAHDAHGNIIEKYNSDGSYSDDWYIYNAFGTNKYFNDTCTPNKWGYCDQLRDWETGNYYMRARYYNPGTGRFISEDPIKDGNNWYSYCTGNPVMFFDPSGQSYKENKRVQNIIEGIRSALQTNSVAVVGNSVKISNWARDEGIKYAEYYNYYSSSGTLVTWDNKSDALRHFLWNARMTRELGVDNASIIAGNHEKVTWDSQKVDGGTIFNIELSSLMDINNNAMGREYALKYDDYSYDELWQKAIEDGVLITSLEQVQQFYNLSDNQIFTKDSTNNLSSKFVKVFVPDNKNSDPHIMTKEEYFKYIDK